MESTIYTVDGKEFELKHYGVKGMKWGVRKKYASTGFTPDGRMRNLDTDTSVTRKVKRDYNNMSDRDFRRKYYTTKSAYAKRVAKYGDPYANSPAVQRARKLSEKQLNKLGKRNDARIRALNRDIDSFKGHEKGIFAKNGTMLLSSDDVKKSVNALKSNRDKYSKQVTDMVRSLSKDYQVSYDVTTGKYVLRLKT